MKVQAAMAVLAFVAAQAAAVPEAQPNLATRDAAPAANAEATKIRKLKNHWGKWCVVPGQACYKARDLSNTVIDQVNDVYGRVYAREALAEAAATPDAAPEADPKKLPNRWGKWCVVPGQACYKKRDAEAIVRAIKSSDPTAFKKECFKEGGECDKLLKIQTAFAQSKKQNAAEKHITNPQHRLAHCKGKNDCSALTHAHQYAAQHSPRSAAAAEEACNGPEGLCTLARRDLEGIEETLNAAVEALHADTADEEGEAVEDDEE